MALVVGSNSWETVAEADDYLENKMNASEWFELSTVGARGAVSKESVLITAYNEILASPLVNISKDSSDNNVKNAQSEMALFILQYYDELMDRRASIASGLSSFSASKIHEAYSSLEGGGSPTLPSNVIGLLFDYNTANTTVELEGE